MIKYPLLPNRPRPDWNKCLYNNLSMYNEINGWKIIFECECWAIVKERKKNYYQIVIK